MSWNYRVIHHPQSFVLNGEEIDTSYLAVHEVHYDEEGKPVLYSKEPISFRCDVEDGKEEILARLMQAIGTIRETDILEESSFDDNITESTPIGHGMEDGSEKT